MNIKDEVAKQLIVKIGLYPAIVIMVILLAIPFVLKGCFETALEKEIQSFKTEIERKSFKNLEVWKDQKKLMFEFVDFLENKIFNMPGEKNERHVILVELNQFYGKLYLVLDAKIINKINEVLNESVSPVQRYYIYREIRAQLLSVLDNQGESAEKDCPYLSLDIGNAAVPSGKDKPKTFDDFKKIYPFVEKGNKEKSYKGLPFFGEQLKQ